MSNDYTQNPLFQVLNEEQQNLVNNIADARKRQQTTLDNANRLQLNRVGDTSSLGSYLYGQEVMADLQNTQDAYNTQNSNYLGDLGTGIQQGWSGTATAVANLFDESSVSIFNSANLGRMAADWITGKNVATEQAKREQEVQIIINQRNKENAAKQAGLVSQYTNETKQSIQDLAGAIDYVYEDENKHPVTKFIQAIGMSFLNPRALGVQIAQSTPTIGAAVMGSVATGNPYVGLAIASISEGASTREDLLQEIEAQGGNRHSKEAQEIANKFGLISGAITALSGALGKAKNIGDLDAKLIAETLKEYPQEVVEEVLIAINQQVGMNTVTGNNLYDGLSRASAEAIGQTLGQGAVQGTLGSLVSLTEHGAVKAVQALQESKKQPINDSNLLNIESKSYNPSVMFLDGVDLYSKATDESSKQIQLDRMQAAYKTAQNDLQQLQSRLEANKDKPDIAQKYSALIQRGQQQLVEIESRIKADDGLAELFGFKTSIKDTLNNVSESVNQALQTVTDIVNVPIQEESSLVSTAQNILANNLKAYDAILNDYNDANTSTDITGVIEAMDKLIESNQKFLADNPQLTEYQSLQIVQSVPQTSGQSSQQTNQQQTTQQTAVPASSKEVSLTVRGQTYKAQLKNDGTGEGDYFEVTTSKGKVKYYNYNEMGSEYHQATRSLANDNLKFSGPRSQTVNKLMSHDLQAMAREFKQKTGKPLTVISAFRSYADQQANLNNKSGFNQDRFGANAWVGGSKHHTGLALDFMSVDNSYWAGKQGQKAFKALQELAPKYGFEMSYPKGNKGGVATEAWEFVYRGKDEQTRAITAQLLAPKNSGVTTSKYTQTNSTVTHGFTPHNFTDINVRKVKDIPHEFKIPFHNVALWSGGKVKADTLGFMQVLDGDESVRQAAKAFTSITGGSHAGGQMSHANGYKIDLDLKTESKEEYIQTAKKVADLARQHGYDVELLIEGPNWSGKVEGYDNIRFLDTREVYGKNMTLLDIKVKGRISANASNNNPTNTQTKRQAIDINTAAATKIINPRHDIVSDSKGSITLELADGTQIVRTGTRGWRNNNVGNLRPSAWTKSQKGYLGEDNAGGDSFAIFDTWENGFNAKVKLFFEGKNYKNLTLDRAIKRYAPEFENDTAAYINKVKSVLPANRQNLKISEFTQEERNAISKAMMEMEGSVITGEIKVIKQGSGFVDVEEPAIGATDTNTNNSSDSISRLKQITEQIEDEETRETFQKQIDVLTEQVAALSGKPADTNQQQETPIQENKGTDSYKQQMGIRYAQLTSDEDISKALTEINTLTASNVLDKDSAKQFRELLEAKRLIMATDMQNVAKQIAQGHKGNNQLSTNLGLKDYEEVLSKALTLGKTKQTEEYLGYLQRFTDNHNQKAQVMTKALDMVKNGDVSAPIKVVNTGNGWEIVDRAVPIKGISKGNSYDIELGYSDKLVAQISNEAMALTKFNDAWKSVLNTPTQTDVVTQTADNLLPKTPINKPSVITAPSDYIEITNSNDIQNTDKIVYTGTTREHNILRTLDSIKENTFESVAGMWGNPYGTSDKLKDYKVATNQEALVKYNNTLKQVLQNENALKELMSVRGKEMSVYKNRMGITKQSADVLKHYANNIPDNLIKEIEQGQFANAMDWVNRQQLVVDDKLKVSFKEKKLVQLTKRQRNLKSKEERESIFTQDKVIKRELDKLKGDDAKYLKEVFGDHTTQEIAKTLLDYTAQDKSEQTNKDYNTFIGYLEERFANNPNNKTKERSTITSSGKKRKQASKGLSSIGVNTNADFEVTSKDSYDESSHKIVDWYYDKQSTLEDDENKVIIQTLIKKYPDLTISFDGSKADIDGTKDITSQLIIKATSLVNDMLITQVDEITGKLTATDKQINALIGSLGFVRREIKRFLRSKEAKEISVKSREILKRIEQSNNPTLLFNKAITDKDIKQILQSIKVKDKVKNNLFSKIIQGITLFLGFKVNTVDNLFEKVLQTAGDIADFQYQEFTMKDSKAKLSVLVGANPKEEKVKPLTQRNIFKAYVSQTNKPLSTVKDFIFELNNTRNKLITSLGVDKPNKEQSIQLDHFINFYEDMASYLEDTFDAMDEGYEYRDLKSYLYNADTQSIDENVLTAVSAAIYDYLIVDAKPSKNYDDIAKLLGIPEDEIKGSNIPSELLTKYKHLGDSNTTVALGLGKYVTNVLGLQISDDAPGEVKSRLEASIGAWAISAMQSANLVHINKLPSHEFLEDQQIAKGTLPTTSKDNASKNAAISFVSVVTEDGKNMNTLVTEIKEVNKGTGGYLSNLLGGESNRKYPSLVKPSKVNTRIKGTNSTVSKKQQEVILKAQEEPYVVNNDMVSAIKALSEIDEELLHEIVGAKVNDGVLSKTQESKKESLLSKAQSTKEALESAMEWIDFVPEKNGIKEFFDTMFVAVNDRMHLNSTVFNVQSNKLHRAMADNKSFKVTIEQVTDKPQWFDDKGNLTPIAYFIRAVFENAEGTEKYFESKLKDLYRQGWTVDKIPTKHFNDVAWEYLNTTEVQQAIKAMQRVQQGQGTKEDIQVIASMVKQWEMEGSSLRALIEVANLFTAIENKTEFTTSLGLGSDGINNGIAIGTYLLGVADRVFNNMVGLFTKDDIHQDYFSTRLDKKIEDYYEGLKKWLNSAIESKEDYLINKMNVSDSEYFEKTFNELKAIKYLNSTLTSRKTLKALLIPFGYGSGFGSLTHAGATQMIADMYVRMEKMATSDKTTQEELNDLNEHLSVLLGKDVALTKDNLLTYEFTKTDLAILRDKYVKIMSGVIQEALSNYAPKLIAARKVINGLHSATSQAYISALNDLADKALQNKKEAIKAQYPDKTEAQLKGILAFEKLSKNELEEQVFKPLRAAFPTIKTGYTVGEQTTEADIELIKKATTLDYDDIVESVSYQFGGEALVKVTNKLGIRIHTFEDTGVRGHSQAVQSSDSVNSSGAMVLEDGTVNQNVHDANIGAIDKQVAMGQAQNRAFFHNLIHYHETLETVKASIKTLKGLDESGLLTKEMTISFIENTMGSDTVKMSVVQSLLDGTQETNQVLENVLTALVEYAKQQELAKLGALAELSVIQQYGTEGGQYIPTEQDADLIKKQIESITNFKASTTIQTDLGMKSVYKNIHYNNFANKDVDISNSIKVYKSDNEVTGEVITQSYDMTDFHQAIQKNPNKKSEYIKTLFGKYKLAKVMQFPITESSVREHGLSLAEEFAERLAQENTSLYESHLETLLEALNSKVDNINRERSTLSEYANKLPTIIYSELSKSGRTERMQLANDNHKADVITHDAINSLDEQFSNPFEQEDNQLAVIKYLDWILYSQDKDAIRIKNELKSGNHKGKTVTYSSQLNEPTYADALDYLINEFDWQEYNKIESERNNAILDIHKQARDTLQDVSSMDGLTNHSGGAYGADTDWDLIGRGYGVNNHIHYKAQGDKLSQRLQKVADIFGLTKEEIEHGINQVNSLLKTQYKNNDVGKLQGRNYYQVKNADAVYAVAPLLNVAGDWVSGGTNTAVRLAIKMKKPVFVFDTTTQKWHTYYQGRFYETETPVLSKNYAGIGTRDIEQYSKHQSGMNEDYLGEYVAKTAHKAMKDVYQKALDNLDTASTTTWSRKSVKGKQNYEVSSKGDKRFSALFATLKDGRTIENAYQLDVKGYRDEVQGEITERSYKTGKGKPSKRHTKEQYEEQYQEYKALWRTYLQENPELLAELLALGNVNFTDMFANTQISQARALSELVNEYHQIGASAINKHDWGNSKPRDTFSLDKLISSLSKLNTHQFNKTLMSWLTEAMNKFNPNLKTIMVTDIPDNIPGKAVAWYDTNTNEIHIIKDRFNALSDDDKSMFVLHEMVHALTEHNLNNPKFSKVKAKLEAIHKQLYEAWQDGVNKGFHEDKLALMLDSRDADGNVLYGELIAYGLTDKAMQKFIGEVLSESDTQAASGFSKVINRFLTVVKQVLGLNNKGLDEFVKVSSQLMGHYEPMTANNGKLYSQSAMKSIEANIKRGTEAMNKTILTKADVKRAMYRNDIGWVDFVWGDVGTIKANGKTKGAMGISHIIEARIRKNGMSYGDVVDMLTNATVEAIAKGKVAHKYGDETHSSLHLEHNGFRASLVKNKGSNAWLINSFEIFDKNKSDDGEEKSIDSTTPTHTTPTLHRDSMGASDKTNVTQNNSNDNSTHLYAQMTKDNVTDIVNQLSLQDVLKNSIFNGSDEFNTHLDKTIDGFIGNYLYNDTNKRKVNQAKAAKPKAFMIGLQMSDKEQAVYEATKAILDEFVKDKTKTSTQAVYELRRVYDEFRKQIKSPKDFAQIYGKDFDSMTKQEKRHLTNIYNGIFTQADGLTVFSALVMSSEKFYEFTNTDRQYLKIKEDTNNLFERVVNAFETVFNWFNGLLLANKSNKINHTIQAITNKLSDMDVKARNAHANMFDMVWERTLYLGSLADKYFVKKPIKAVLSSSLMPDSIKLSTYALSLHNPEEMAETAVEIIQNKLNPKQRYQELGNLVTEITSATNISKILSLRVSLTQKVAQIRQMYKSNTIKLLQQSFSRELNQDELSLLGKVVLRTDVQSLLKKYDMNQVMALLTNEAKRKEQIQVLKHQLHDAFGKDTNDVLKRTKSLAVYMNDGTTSQFLTKSAYGIAAGLGTQYRKDLANVDESVVDLIDSYVTLIALDSQSKHINQSQLFKDELDGIKTMIKTHQDIVKKAEDDFKFNRINLQKGYMPEITHPKKSVIWVTQENIQRKFNEGWELITPEGLKTDEVHKDAEKVYMMYHPRLGRVKRVSGATDLADNHAKGTIVYDSSHGQDFTVAVKEKLQKMSTLTNSADDYNPREEHGSLVFSYNADGSIANLHYEMAGYVRDQYLERDHNAFEMLGVLSGQVEFKPLIKNQQKEIAVELYKDYADNYKNRPSSFVLLDPESTDPKVRDDFMLIPYAMREELVKQFGAGKPIYVRASVYNTVFGYKKYSIREIFDKAYSIQESKEKGYQSNLRLNMLEQILYHTFKGFALISRKNEKNLAVIVEDIIQAIVGQGKDFIVIRSGKVLLGNIIANMLLLALHGINPLKMPKLLLKSWSEASQYRKWYNEHILLTVGLNIKSGSELAKDKQRIKQLESYMRSSYIHDYMKAGLMSTIVEDVDMVDKSETVLDEQISKVTKYVPQNIKTAFDWLMINPNTPLHKFLSDATQFSDFSSKVVLAEHLRSKGMNLKDALAEANESFINFDVPTGKGMQYMNDMGFFMFTKFFLRFQKVIVKKFKEKPAQLVAQHLFMENVMDMAGFADPFFLSRLGNNPFSAGPLTTLDASDNILTINAIQGFF